MTLSYMWTMLIVIMFVAAGSAAPAPKPPAPPKNPSLNQGKVEGTEWTSRARTVQGLNLPAGHLQITFGNDMTLTYGGMAAPYLCKFEFMPGHEIKLFTDQNNGTVTSIKVVVEGDSLTMSLLDGTIPVVFDRIKADAAAPKGK